MTRELEFETLLRYESGWLTEQETLQLFSYLIKTVCAWVSCKKVEVSTCNFSRLYPVEESAISYNPKRQPNWVDFNGEVIDGVTYKKVVSVKNHLYAY